LEDLMGVAKLAKYLMVNPQTIYNWVSQDKIPYAKIGDLLRFRKSDIDKWISAKTTYPTIDVPLVGAVSCGVPLLAEENLEAQIPVSTKIARPPHKYFILKAIGNSMDRAGIKSGDMILVRQQASAEDSQLVVALIEDEATIKRLRIYKDYVILEPDSTEPDHQPIKLDKNFRIQGVVVKTL